MTKSENSSFFHLGRGQLTITSPFGNRVHPVTGKNHFHTGTDYALNAGNPLCSPFDGIVTYVEHNHSGFGGNVLVYNEELGLSYHAAHMRKVNVKVGDKVTRHMQLGESGGVKGVYGSGTSTGAHVHSGLAKGRYTHISQVLQNAWLDIEKFDFSKALETKPTPKPQSDLDKVAKEVMALGVDKVLARIKEIEAENNKPKVNEYGQAVFEGNTITFSYIYASSTGKGGKVPYFKNHEGRGYGVVKKIHKNAVAPYEVTKDDKLGPTVGFVKPVNVYGVK